MTVEDMHVICIRCYRYAIKVIKVMKVMKVAKVDSIQTMRKADKCHLNLKYGANESFIQH